MLRGRVTNSYRLTAIIAAILVTGAPAALAAGRPRPEMTSAITVVKTARRAPKVEGYRVGPHEHLWQILRQRAGGISERGICRLYTRTLRLNPGLRPNRLEAGQLIRLPVVARKGGEAPGGARAGSATPAGQAAESIQPSGQAEVPGGGQPQPTAPTEPKAASIAAARAGDALSALYAELGEEAVTQGKQFIPLLDTGQVILDASKFPLLQVGGSTRFVVDAAGSIPPEVDGLLSEAGGLRVLRLDAQRGVKGLIDDALLGSGLPVEGAGRLTLAGPVEAELRSDWLVSRGEQREVICLITSPEQATSAAVARHLAGRGVHVIDVLVPAEGAPVRVLRPEALALPDYAPPEVAKGTGEMVSRVLALLGQGYERNAMVSVFGGREGGPAGFNLRLCADFGFERGGKQCLIDMAGLSARWREFLERRGYQVLVIDQAAGGREAAATLLRFLGQKYEEGYSLLAAKRPESSNISLKVPGVVVQAGEATILLSDADTDEGLACALSQAGLKVIQLK
jgi:hypothetical protein